MFGGCSSLTSVTIPNSVTSIGDAAFFSCTSLTSVTVPNSVTSIGQDAFFYCTSLTGVYFQGSAPSVGSDVFAGDNNATVYYLAGTTGWGTTFGGRPTALWSLPVPYTYTTNNGTITITGYTGSGGAVTIPSTIIGLAVASIGDSAFSGFGLTSVTIPNSVTSIGARAFSYCTSLAAITVDALNPSYSSVAGVLFNKSQNTLIECPGGKAGSYMIPDSVTSIGDWAFLWCTSLTSVTIPNSVTSIGDDVFYNCASLTSVTIPSSVTSIGRSAFESCYSLTNVTIPSSVTSIGVATFFWCTSLTSVTIPNSVTSIGAAAFFYCTNLTGVYCQGNAPSIGSSVFFADNNATVYYLPGTTGWGTTFGGRPTALWLLPNPLILNIGPSFGVQTNQFGFIISWATNIPIVVEACTNLAHPTWSPVGTNTLTGGSSYFSDPQWTNYPARLYRLRSP